MVRLPRLNGWCFMSRCVPVTFAAGALLVAARSGYCSTPGTAVAQADARAALQAEPGDGSRPLPRIPALVGGSACATRQT